MPTCNCAPAKPLTKGCQDALLIDDTAMYEVTTLGMCSVINPHVTALIHPSRQRARMRILQECGDFPDLMGRAAERSAFTI